MKKAILFLFGLMITTVMFAQTSPNFNKTSTEGGEFDLYTELDSGRVVIIDIFATWCGPCAQSHPVLQSIFEDYGSGERVVVWGLDVDDTESESTINTYKSNKDLTYPMFEECYYPWQKFDITSNPDFGYIPHFIIISPEDSSIVYEAVGWASYMETEMRDKITELGVYPTSVKNMADNNQLTLNFSPNPVKDQVNITLNIKNTDYVKLDIFNMLGKKVVTILNETKLRGEYLITHDVSNLPIGNYLIKLGTSNGSVTSILAITR